MGAVRVGCITFGVCSLFLFGFDAHTFTWICIHLKDLLKLTPGICQPFSPAYANPTKFKVHPLLSHTHLLLPDLLHEIRNLELLHQGRVLTRHVLVQRRVSLVDDRPSRFKIQG